MTELVPFEPRQRLRIGLGGHDRELAADVLEVTEDALSLELAEPALWLEDHHLEPGVDLGFWQKGARHLAERVPVLAFDLDRGRLHLSRPAQTRIVQRRKTFREAVELPVRLAPADGGDPRGLGSKSAVTQDIGGGGVCLETSDLSPPEVGDELQLELDLPGHSVRARGRVRWAEPGTEGSLRIGVAFTRIAERDQDMVYGFLFDLQRTRLRA